MKCNTHPVVSIPVTILKISITIFLLSSLCMVRSLLAQDKYYSFTSSSNKVILAESEEPVEMNKRSDKRSKEKEISGSKIDDAGTSTRITAHDIDIRGDTELTDSLSMVPGIHVKTMLTGKGFTMRGYSEDTVAVLVDGILINDSFEGRANISQIPMANISHLVVNRGVSSALYGTYGVIGSINIITRKPSVMYTEAHAEYGQYNNVLLSVGHGAPIDNFFYWITATMHHSDGYAPSKKLTGEKRREWFDRILRYDLYGKSFEDIDLKAVDSYLNDTGRWDHNSYRRYHLSGKLGYTISNRFELGISTLYYHNRAQSVNYDDNLYSTYRGGEWYEPNPTAYTVDGKDAVFQVQARNWPEDIRLTVVPYCHYRNGRLSIQFNSFIYWHTDTLESFADTDHTTFMFPAEVYWWDAGENVAKRFSNNFYQSIFTDRSLGFHLLPSYRYGSGRISSSVIYRIDNHLEEIKPFEDGSAPDIIAVHGTGAFRSKLLEVQYLTIAAENELQPIKNLFLTAGISYDAQNLTDHKRRSMEEETLNEYVDGYLAEDDSIIWGTRDSFNPVIGAVYHLGDSFLIRAAASRKTKFPTLKAYSRMSDVSGDLNLKPEHSTNGNAGIEVIFFKACTWRLDYFYSRFSDKIAQAFNEELGGQYFVNLDGVETQGIETILTAHTRIIGFGDLSINLTYVYVRSVNMDNTADIRLNMGNRFELTPEHQFTADLRFSAVTGTSLIVYGNHTRNQIVYAMREKPEVDDPFSTVYFKSVSLHNPIFLNIKLSQRLCSEVNLYVLCKNVFDDYKADPFNPGPGRMWYFGGKIQL
jgi:outer membrane cobalamin receptor